MSNIETGITISAEDANKIKIDEDNAKSTNNYQQCYTDILSLIGKYSATQPLSAKALYWYTEAQKINDHNDSSDAKTFIRDVAKTGNLLSGYTLDTQEVSNAIADNVANTVSNTHILGINELLGTDAFTAFSKFHVTMGGWGGSFYYWNTTLHNTSAGINYTPGSQILQNLPYAGAGYDMGGEYDKFLASNSYGISQVIDTQGYSTVLWNGIKSIAGDGAELPFRQTADLIGRFYQEKMYGAPIVGNPDEIDQYHFDPTDNKWFTASIFPTISFNSTLTATYVDNATTTANLNRERAYRTAHEGLTLTSTKQYEDTDTIPTTTQTTSTTSPQTQASVYIDDNKNLEETMFIPASGTNVPFSSLIQNETNINGLMFISANQTFAPGQLKPDSQSITLFDSSRNASMSENFSNIDQETGQTTDALTLDTVSIFNTGTSNTQNSAIDNIVASIQNGTIQDETISYKDGSSLTHMFTASKYWEEMKTDSTGALTQDVTYGETIDPDTGNTVVGTTVTNETDFTQTFFKDGDPNAPGMSLSPSELLSMAGLSDTWSTLYQQGLTGTPQSYSGSSSIASAGPISAATISLSDSTHHDTLAALTTGNQYT